MEPSLIDPETPLIDQQPDPEEELNLEAEVQTNAIEPTPVVYSGDFFAMNNQIHLDSFKGQGEDPTKWFMYFERWATFMNMADDRAALAMPFERSC